MRCMRVFLASVVLLIVAPLTAFVSQPADAERGLGKGALAPPIDMRDQFGRRQTLQSLVGDKGLVLLFVRSADW
jgi:hypothetical protein